MSHLTRPGFARGLRGTPIVGGALLTRALLTTALLTTALLTTALLTTASPAEAKPAYPGASAKVAYGGGDYYSAPVSSPAPPVNLSDVGLLLGAARFNIQVIGPKAPIQATIEVPTGPFAYPTPVPVRLWATSTTPQPDLDAKICATADCFDVLATVKIPVRDVVSGIEPLEVVVFSGPGSVFLHVDSHQTGGRNYRGGYMGRSAPMWSVALAGTVAQDLPDVAFGERTAEHGRRTGLRGVRAGNRLNDYPFLVHAFDAVVMGPSAETSPALAVELEKFVAAGGVVVSDQNTVPSAIASTAFSPVQHAGRDMLTYNSNLVANAPAGVLPFTAAKHGDGHWIARTSYGTGHELAAALLETKASFSENQAKFSYLASRPESDAAKVATYRRNGGVVSTLLALLWVVFALVLFGFVRRRGWRTAISVLAGASFVSTIGFIAVASVWRNSSESVKVTTLEREYGGSTVMEWGTSAQRTGVLSSKAKLWVPAGHNYARTLVHRSGNIESVERDGTLVKVRTSSDEVVMTHWRRVLPGAESLLVHWAGNDEDWSFTNSTSHPLRFAALRTGTNIRYVENIPSSSRSGWEDMLVGTYSMDSNVKRTASDISALRYLRELTDDCIDSRLSPKQGRDVCAVGISVLPDGQLIGYRTQGRVTSQTTVAENARVAAANATVAK